ncbi:GNAT family N-acetyltransferase [Viridibacillus arvi]|uniref:Acetyltransferase n=1 Tax=Viridibacillus arvi TaxID=263475 RepID=A0A0M0L9S5_9BACL|nr:GNAT family N-acetyltransferase [Viridibacillus arvi]KOO47398.1 acetyltransferase [Viridibacillus arvi]
MYWCKIAQTEHEFDEIAKLNYETFVEEIPQHEPNPSGRRVDAFHHENMYLVVLKDEELVGMVAFRDVRPFSLDKKIGPVEKLLPADALLGKLCEVRLLAVKKEHRNGRVFFMLTRALIDYAYENGYGAAVISGTVREEKLYMQMGFEAFSEPVGANDAKFIPMVLTTERYEKSLAGRFKQRRYSFYPGPVQMTDAIQAPLLKTPVSHRSYSFSRTIGQVRSKLEVLSGARYAHLLLGSGTLANEAMIAQLTKLSGRGLIVTNGAFGERLQKQAERWHLEHDWLRYDWGQSFNEAELESILKQSDFEWLLMAHGETSTGMLNNLEMVQNLCETYNVKLCMDCVSSFGTYRFSMEKVFIATAVSGKAVGTMSGIAVVFSNHVIAKSEQLPSYIDLGNYSNHNIPFTYPAQLMESFNNALLAYTEGNRYDLLQTRYKKLQQAAIDGDFIFLTTEGYPMIVTLKADESLTSMADAAAMNGFHLHYESAYLKERGWVQISIIQPDFDDAWERFKKWYSKYKEYRKLKC